jgi:hypothetical protein
VPNHFPSRLHTRGYAGLYTLDINPWAVILTATDVDSHKLSARTGGDRGWSQENVQGRTVLREFGASRGV